MYSAFIRNFATQKGITDREAYDFFMCKPGTPRVVEITNKILENQNEK